MTAECFSTQGPAGDVSKAVRPVRLRNTIHPAQPDSDKQHVKMKMQEARRRQTLSIPWAMQMKAVSTEDPSRLVQALTGAILGCGGWVLSRGASDTGRVNMLFEFERQACVDIYTILIAAGLELSQNGHIRLTELCQCTRSQQWDCGAEIASVDLEIQTFPAEILMCCSRQVLRERKAAKSAGCFYSWLPKSRTPNAGPSTAVATATFAQDDQTFMMRTLETGCHRNKRRR